MIIKNISNNNININNQILKPFETLNIDNIDKVKTLLNIGYIKIIKDEEKMLDKDKILEAFFNFHLNKCDDDDLKIVKTFYSEVFPYINEDIKKQINKTNTTEELIEILLNSFYPILIKKIEGE